MWLRIYCIFVFSILFPLVSIAAVALFQRFREGVFSAKSVQIGRRRRRRLPPELIFECLRCTGYAKCAQIGRSAKASPSLGCPVRALAQNRLQTMQRHIELHLSGVNRDFGAGTKNMMRNGTASINLDRLLFACLVRFEYNRFKNSNDNGEEVVTKRDLCDSCCLTLHPEGMIFWEVSKDDMQPNNPTQYTMLRKIHMDSDTVDCFQMEIDDHTGQLQIREKKSTGGSSKWLFGPVNLGEFPWLVEALTDFPPTEEQGWRARIRSWFSTVATKKLPTKYGPIERVPIYRPTVRVFGGGNPRPSTSHRASTAPQATCTKCCPNCYGTGLSR